MKQCNNPHNATGSTWQCYIPNISWSLKTSQMATWPYIYYLTLLDRSHKYNDGISALTYEVECPESG